VSADDPALPDATYSTDGLGLRRSRTSGGVTTWWRPGGSEYADSSGSIGARTKTYLGGLGEIAGSNPSTGTYSYYVTDHLGSTRRILDGNRVLLARYDYMPYGGPLHHAGLPLDRGFTGHKWDPASDAYYAPFRYYSPGMARWMTRDPLGYVDGTNVYGYVAGSPVMLIDPLGLVTGRGAACNTGLILGGIVGVGVGGAVGAELGAWIGGAVGSVIPGAGTVLGTIAGAGVGFLIGWGIAEFSAATATFAYDVADGVRIGAEFYYDYFFSGMSGAEVYQKHTGGPPLKNFSKRPCTSYNLNL